MAVLIILSSLIHIYLWAMVMIIFGAMAASDVLLGPHGRLGALVWSMGLLGLAALCIVGIGYLGLRSSAENTGYPTFTTNLLSPFYSSHSWFSPRSVELLRQMRADSSAWTFFVNQRPDATGGQYYEGASYLGAGVLLIAALAVVRIGRAGIGTILRRHIFLVGVAFVALAFAVSPQLTFGDTVIRLWTLDNALLSMLSAFRASGRFVWIPAYLLMIAAIVIVVRTTPRPIGAGLLAAAALLQFIDAQPLRKAIAFDTQRGVPFFDEDAWRPILAETLQIIILPSFECAEERGSEPKTGLHILAARLGPIPINSASQSRSTKDCLREMEVLDEGLQPRHAYFFFKADPAREPIQRFIEEHQDRCRPFDYGIVCLQ
jgi:hypothetical protein